MIRSTGASVTAVSVIWRVGTTEPWRMTPLSGRRRCAVTVEDVSRRNEPKRGGGSTGASRPSRLQLQWKTSASSFFRSCYWNGFCNVG